MSLRFVCPRCWSVREALDEALLGKTIKCNDCHGMYVAKHTPDPNKKRPTRKANRQAVAGVEEDTTIMPALADNSGRSAFVGRDVVLSTSGLPKGSEIVDLVFAHSAMSEAPAQGASFNEVFQNVKHRLAQEAARIGADAVINIQFDFKTDANSVEPGRSFEVFACGTAVRLHKKST